MSKRSDIGDVVKLVEKAHGKGALMCLDGGSFEEPMESLASGCISLDRALGIGGYPRGRIIEIFGPESSGKTTLALHALAEVQRAGGIAALIDAEHAFDPRYARSIGVQLESLLVSQPDHGEQALDIVETLAKSQAVSLVVVDSVAALVPKAELDGDMGDSHMGLHARLMSQATRKITGVCNRHGTTVIFINQVMQMDSCCEGTPGIVGPLNGDKGHQVQCFAPPQRGEWH